MSYKNKNSNAYRDLNSAKNLAKAAGKAAAQNYVGAAIDVAKETVSNPEGLLRIIAIALLPFFIIIILIISPFAAFYANTNDFSNMAVTEKANIGVSFEETIKKEIYNAVLKAYKEAQKEIIKKINIDANILKENYDYFEYSINEIIIDNLIIPDEEIAKIYACFSVLMEREFLLDASSLKLNNSKEKEIFDKEKLTKIIKENVDKILTYEVVDNSYVKEILNEETGENETYTYGAFEFNIKFKNIENIATDVFGLQDNSNNMEIDEKIRYNEIKMAENKQISLLSLMGIDVRQVAYVTVNNATYKAKIDELKSLNRVILNINFTPNKKMQYPLKDYPINITSKFGNRINPHDSTKTQFHHGIDFSANSGTDIYPIANGIIIEKGYNSTYGNFVVVYHGDIAGKDYVTVYMHMLEPTPYKYNADVNINVSIGKVGNTGLSTGSHLHFAVLVSQDNGALAYVNPETFIIK